METNPYSPPLPESKDDKPADEDRNASGPFPFSALDLVALLVIWVLTLGNLVAVATLFTIAFAIFNSIGRFVPDRRVAWTIRLAMLAGISPVDIAFVRDGQGAEISLAHIFYAHDSLNRVLQTSPTSLIENRDFIVRLNRPLLPIARYCIVINLP